MTFPDSCLQCEYHDSDDYPDTDDDFGDYMIVGCDLCREWVSPDLWMNDTLPDWCPLKEMWRR